MSQARKFSCFSYFSRILTLARRLAVGLGIDCSPWVEAGLITHAGMLDRNWALWTTFCQVRLTYTMHTASVDSHLQDTTWSLYVGREFCTTSSANSKPSQYRSSRPTWIHFWEAGRRRKMKPNRISGTFAATCSLMQIAREVADAVYVRTAIVLGPGLLMDTIAATFLVSGFARKQTSSA
jgi:hypothetical protein